MKRRATDDQSDVAAAEIRKQRASAFDWAQLLLPNAPVIVKILLLLGLGAGTAVTAPKAINFLNGTPPIAEGETVVPEQISPALKQSLDSMNAAIRKLQAADTAGDRASNNADVEQNARLDKLERLVQ